MKNNKIRNSLVAAGIAVLAGVLVLSVSVAIGDAPGYDPPSGAGVSPVFSGMQVTGIANINDISLNGSMSGGSIVTDSLTSYGSISGSSISSAGNIEITGAGADLRVADDIYAFDDTFIYSDLWLRYNSTNIRNYAGSTVTIADNLSVSGDATATGRVTADTIVSNDWITATNAIASYGDVIAYGDAIVGGNLTADGAIGLFYDVNNKQDNVGWSYDVCNSGHYLIDCAGWVSSGSIDYIYNVGNYCYVASSNGSADVRAYAKCFSTDGHL